MPPTELFFCVVRLRLLQYTYNLSSLLLRRVLTKTTTLTAYGEKTQQLLLDQSQLALPQASSTTAVNVAVAAVKLLELDREWN